MNHLLMCDTEAVFTDDGDPQPRSSVFVECLDINCDCHGDFILHDHEIAEYIERAEEAQAELKKLLAEAEEHRTRYTEQNSKDGDPYWRGRRDEAGHFRDKLQKILDLLHVKEEKHE